MHSRGCHELAFCDSMLSHLAGSNCFIELAAHPALGGRTGDDVSERHPVNVDVPALERARVEIRSLGSLCVRQIAITPVCA